MKSEQANVPPEATARGAATPVPLPPAPVLGPAQPAPPVARRPMPPQTVLLAQAAAHAAALTGDDRVVRGRARRVAARGTA